MGCQGAKMCFLFIGRIGLVIDCQWYEPATNSTEDVEAAERRQQFEVSRDKY